MRKPRILTISGWAHGGDAFASVAEPLLNIGDVSFVSPAELMRAKAVAPEIEAPHLYARALLQLIGETVPATYSPLVPAAAKDCRPPDDDLQLSGTREELEGRNPLRPKHKAERTARTASEIDMAPCVLIGWSMGGMIALETALNCQERIGKLVLLSSTPRFCATDGYPHGTSEAVVRGMLRGVKASAEKTLGEFLQHVASPGQFDDKDLRLGLDAAKKQGLPALQEGLQYLLKTDLRDKLNAIQCPTLVIHGKQDAVIPWQAGECLSKGIAGSRFVVYEDAGHNILRTEAAEVAAEIARFLE